MKALKTTSVVLSLALLALLAFCVARRLTFPFELEWMEGASLMHVRRLALGLPLYVRPSLDFVPFAYPPFYYYVCLPFVRLIGDGFTAIRLTSVLATTSTLTLVWLTVKRHSGNLAGMLAAGVFAGCYALSDGWLDLGRVDALYVALLAATWFVAADARTTRQWTITAFIGSLAFFTKQPAPLALLPLGALLLVTERKQAIVFVTVSILVSTAVFVVLNWSTSGWYAYYVFGIPRLRMAVSGGGGRGLSFWTADLLPVGIAVIAGAYSAIRERHWRHAALAAGCVGSSWMARLEGGAWNNAVLPAYLAASILFGLWLRPSRQARMLVMGIATAQLAMLLYDPRPFTPTQANRAAGEAIVQELKNLPGPLLVFDHNSWSSLAGRREYAHGWAITDVLWADQSAVSRSLQDEVRKAISSHAFGTIVKDEGQSWFDEDLGKWYDKRGTLSAVADSYRMQSGADRTPRFILTPNYNRINDLRESTRGQLSR